MTQKIFESLSFSKLEINQDKTLLRLTKSDGSLLFVIAYGDCCSSTWIEHIDNVQALICNKPVFEEELVHVSNDWVDQELIRCDVYKLKTIDGMITIEFRNSSNGYYSGWLEVTDSKSVNRRTSFKEVTEDF
jgi:hypothetical protein